MTAAAAAADRLLGSRSRVHACWQCGRAGADAGAEGAAAVGAAAGRRVDQDRRVQVFRLIYLKLIYI